ncbi:MAG: DNA polymerase III subunit alpha [Candidatus Hydrogenedentota bacterium]
MSADFAHLHCHTEYSVLDGACKIKEILQKCRDFDMDSCAITDHGVLFGAVEFQEMAKEMGIKPIIGCELYLAPESRFDKVNRPGKNNFHFLTICENLTGYHNLCKLSSAGFTEGFYYKPRVDLELLAKYSEGLIATTSCLAGEVPQWLMEDKIDKANEALLRYVDIFGKDNFLVELMDHGMEEQKKVNEYLVDMAEKHGLMLIATNDCHYINKEDAEPHEALLCIQTNGMLDDEDHFKFPSDEVYFKTPDEMRDVFPDHPEALSNTQKIADRCHVDIPLGQHLIPEYVTPEGIEKLQYLTALVNAGLEFRYGGERDKKYSERADFELGIIDKMGFVDYFLVVWDLIEFARRKGIPVGPGRGSGAGSIVAYALNITNIDPMRYNLLFERFLNPERVSMPDFDIDFCYRRREEMIQYSYDKYGAENVSQIITFGRMLAKNVVRNVGRVLGMPYAEVDHIAKLIPDELKITLESAYEKEPDLKQIVDHDPQVARLWRLALRLEGTISNCGTHAAGVVICDKPLTDFVALYQAKGTEAIATQVEMRWVEEVGLLKMDFLGLRTLTVVHDTVHIVKESKGIDIDIDNIECDDENAYQLLRSGKTTGVFQLESPGMRDLAKRIGLQSLEEICALVALYRPGPMKFIDAYIDGKYAPNNIKYEHPLLEPILAETYGIAVYQEQVMQIVQAVAGFSLGQADILRRAMGKKKVDLMAEQRAKFVKGCDENDIGEKVAASLFDKIETFAGYGFNKSHSMAYAFVAYQTAFLKANYTAEFMAALLTSESGNLDKVAIYVDECQRLGIEVLPPDINKSVKNFTVVEGNINFGLAAIKNVGDKPIKEIVRERNENGPFNDIYDFCARLASRQVNRRLIESLNKAGAFVNTDWSRAQVDTVLEAALDEAQIAQKDREAGQSSLLDLMGGEEDSGGGSALTEKPDIPEWEEAIVLQNEKEMLGLYISSHPLKKHMDALRRYATPGLTDLREFSEGRIVNVGGMLSQVKFHMTAKGKKMAFVTVDTLEGPIEITIFTNTYEEYHELLQVDEVIMIHSHVNYRNKEAGLVADALYPIEGIEQRLTKAVHIRLPQKEAANGVVRKLAELLGENSGSCNVFLHYEDAKNTEFIVHATSSCMVGPSPQLRKQVELLVGEGSYWCSAGIGLPSHNSDTEEHIRPEPRRYPRKNAANG